MVLEDFLNGPYKSEGERRIAQFLTNTGLQYEYERPLLVLDRGQSRIWYPDFTLPKESIYLEYFGLAGNVEYDRGIHHKLLTYEENDFSVVAIYPIQLKKPNWEYALLEQIDSVLDSRLQDYRRMTQGYLQKYAKESLYDPRYR